MASGTVETTFSCIRAGTYTVVVRGFSKPAADEYARVRVVLDGQPVGETEIASPTSGTFTVGTVQLGEGAHHLTLAYTNDLYQDGQDRDLYLNAIGFR